MSGSIDTARFLHGIHGQIAGGTNRDAFRKYVRRNQAMERTFQRLMSDLCSKHPSGSYALLEDALAAFRGAYTDDDDILKS